MYGFFSKTSPNERDTRQIDKYHETRFEHGCEKNSSFKCKDSYFVPKKGWLTKFNFEQFQITARADSSICPSDSAGSSIKAPCQFNEGTEGNLNGQGSTVRQLVNRKAHP